jgi:hypothetical protein
MYLWKSWRDTHAFCLILLIIAAAVMPVAAVACVGTHLVEDFGPSASQSTRALILNIVAFGLGAICAINEFADQTAHFLFTKPRTRAYFVWVGWLVGCIELVAIGLVNLLSSWLTLSHYTKHPFRSTVFGSVRIQDVVSVFIYCIFVYCLTYALTAVLRNGLKGLGASVGILTGITAIAALLRIRWNIDLPTPSAPIGSLPLIVSNTLWILVALLFVLGGQMVIERTEI